MQLIVVDVVVVPKSGGNPNRDVDVSRDPEAKAGFYSSAAKSVSAQNANEHAH